MPKLYLNLYIPFESFQLMQVVKPQLQRFAGLAFLQRPYRTVHTDRLSPNFFSTTER